MNPRAFVFLIDDLVYVCIFIIFYVHPSHTQLNPTRSPSPQVRHHSTAAMTVLMQCAVQSLRAGATNIAFVQGLFTAIIREVTEAFKIEDDISGS